MSEWQKLSSKGLKEAIGISKGICVLPVGVIEPHGLHCPLGVDYKMAEYIANTACNITNVVAFPSLQFGSVYESQALVGAISLKPKLLLELYMNILDEIGRNGFTKIIVVNGHGGNTNFLRQLALSCLSERRSYVLYVIDEAGCLTNSQVAAMDEQNEGRPWGHACEYETGVAMCLYGADSVDFNSIPPKTITYEPNKSIKYESNRLCTPLHVITPIDWNIVAPLCYIGNANYATIEKGQQWLDNSVENVVKTINIIKEDNDTFIRMQEYYDKAFSVG